MKKISLLTLMILFASAVAYAQVGISADNSSPDPSAMLDVKSSTKGFLPPRMSTNQRNNIVTPVSGLVIYNTDCNDMQYFNSAEWVPVGKTGMLSAPGTIIGNTESWSTTGQVIYSVDPVSGATGYSWSVPSGTVILAGQGTASITVTSASITGSVCVSAYNDCYRSVINCLPVNLIPILPLGISISASATTVCSGTPVTYTAIPVNGGDEPIFQWKVNGNNVGTNAITYTYLPANHDEVSCDLTISSSSTTGDTAHSNVVAMEVINTGPVGVTINADPHPNCSDPMFGYVAALTNGGSNPTYQWILNGDIIPGATNNTFSTSATGTIACQIVSNSPCIVGSSTVTNFLETSECQQVANGEPLYLFCSLAGCDNQGAVFSWVNSTGTWTSDERDPVIYPDSNGYATDVFYLTVNFSPPVGSMSQGVYFIQVTP